MTPPLSHVIKALPCAVDGFAVKQCVGNVIQFFEYCVNCYKGLFKYINKLQNVSASNFKWRHSSLVSFQLGLTPCYKVAETAICYGGW